MSEVEQAKAVAQVREKRMVRVSSFSVPITPIGKGFSSENVESNGESYDTSLRILLLRLLRFLTLFSQSAKYYAFEQT